MFSDREHRKEQVVVSKVNVILYLMYIEEYFLFPTVFL